MIPYKCPIALATFLAFLFGKALGAESCRLWVKGQHFQPTLVAGEVADACRNAAPSFLPECFSDHRYECQWVADLKARGLIQSYAGNDSIEAATLAQLDLEKLKNYQLAASLRLSPEDESSKLEVPGDVAFLKANFRLVLLEQLNADLKTLREDISFKRQERVVLWKIYMESTLIPLLEAKLMAFPYFDDQDRGQILESLRKISLGTMAEAKNLIDEDPGKVESFRSNLIHRMFIKMAAGTADLDPPARVEFQRQFIRLSLSLGLSMPAACQLEPASLDLCLAWEKWAQTPYASMEALEILAKSLQTLAVSMHFLKATVHGYPFESDGPSQATLKLLKELSRLKDQQSFDRAYAAVFLANGSFFEDGAERWNKLTHGLAPFKGAAFFAQGSATRPIACSLFRSGVADKKIFADKKIRAVLLSIQALLTELRDASVTSEGLTVFGTRLDDLNSQLDRAIEESNHLIQFPGLVWDRMVQVSWDLKQLHLPLQTIVGSRIQIEFVRSGDFYWDPQSGLSLNDTIPELAELMTYGATLLPYGGGRVGSDGRLQAKLKLSPESACMGQSISIAFRFPDLDPYKIFALEAELD